MFYRFGFLESSEKIKGRAGWDIKRVVLYTVNDGGFPELFYLASERIIGGTRTFHKIAFHTPDLYQTSNIPERGAT